MIPKVLPIAVAAICFSAPVHGEPTGRSIKLDAAFGDNGLADITSLAVFTNDSEYLFAVTKRNIEVFRCKDGARINSVSLPNLQSSVSDKPVRRLTLGLEGRHFCGRVLQGYQDVRYDPRFKASINMGAGPLPTDRAKHNHKMQFHRPAFLELVNNGSQLLAGIAEREAFLLDVNQLTAGQKVKPELLFGRQPETELTSFGAALDEHRFVFLREDVSIPETLRRSATKLSRPAEQANAGRLVLFDRRTNKFDQTTEIILDNPFSANMRKRFQVFTLIDPRPRGSEIGGIQIGCVMDDTPPKQFQVPFRRFVATWDDQGNGTVEYADPLMLNAQPHMISPGLRFYVSSNDEGYHRGITAPRMGSLRANDQPTATKRYDSVANHYWVNDTLHAVFSPDDSLCAINDVKMNSNNPIKNTEVAVFDTATRQRQFVLPTGDGNSAYVIAFSPNKRFALTLTRGGGMADSHAKIWQLPTKAQP